MDEFDRASELEEKDRGVAIAAARANAAAEARFKPCGVCHNCGEVVAPEQAYCDENCKDDHQHRIGRGRA